MSMPNIPDITPEINLCREDVINLLLSSISLEEIALSHIINAESEKIMCYINSCNKCNVYKELIEINSSVEKVLNEVSTIESLLVTKLKYINEIFDLKNCSKIEDTCKCCLEKKEFENKCNCNCNARDNYLEKDCLKFNNINNLDTQNTCNLNDFYYNDDEYNKNYNKLYNIFKKIFR